MYIECLKKMAFTLTKAQSKMLKHNYHNVLNSRVLLYFIFFLSITDIILFTASKEYGSVIVFILIGLLTSFFSKNMMVIFTMALVGTNILRFGNEIRIEGMAESMDEDEEDPADKLDAELKKEMKEENFDDDDLEKYLSAKKTPSAALKVPSGSDPAKKAPASAPAPAPAASDKKSKESMVDLDTLDEQTNMLLKNQKKLLEKMENLNPLLDNADKFMQNFNVANT